MSTNTIGVILMSTHNIGFNEGTTKIIFKLSFNYHQIRTLSDGSVAT